jgi:ATP-dependent protease ClpP protease subunit
MAKLSLNIDGFIGSWGYSKQWLNQMLDGHDGDEVDCTVSSLGGKLDDALAMLDKFALHGNVSVFFSGFSASAATIFPMGAKKRVISSNAFFLVHKAMSWIDEFGYMNEDDIDALIQRLEKEKNENAKMTLQIAKIYAGATGKPIKDLLDLMKQSTWLTADEALEWGFVHEIKTMSGSQTNFLNDLSRVAMITACGLPSPTRKNQSNPVQKSPPVMNTNFNFINDLLGFEGIESSADGVFLSLEQLQTINDKGNFHNTEILRFTNELKIATDNLAQAQADLGTANDDLGTANSTIALRDAEITRIANELTTAQQNVETERTEAQRINTEMAENNTAIDAIHESVAAAATFSEKVVAIRQIIASKPGDNPIGNMSTQDPHTSSNDVDWNTIDKLPHNQQFALK